MTKPATRFGPVKPAARKAAPAAKRRPVIQKGSPRRGEGRFPPPVVHKGRPARK